MEVEHGRQAQTWGTNATNQHLATTKGSGEARPDGPRTGHEGAIRVDSSDRIRTDSAKFTRFIAGGILSQMIKQASNHRDEMSECVEWYTKKLKESNEALEHLQKLQSFLETQDLEGEEGDRAEL